jgi:hypothetical protein
MESAMRRITARQVIDERNKRLMNWVTDELGLEGAERQEIHEEMMLLFRHATENELAEYLWEKLSPKNTIRTVDAAKEIIMRFYDIALGWLNNTAEDQRN